MKRKDVIKLRRAIEQAVQYLPAEVALEVPSLFKKWTVGEAVILNDIRQYNGVLYKIARPHTTQADWTPDITPALWKVVVPEGVIPEWKQPAGAHDSYQVGDRVTYKGGTYECTSANNVYAPDVYGWKKL